MRTAALHIYKRKDRKFGWRFIAPNGRELASPQGFTVKANAIKNWQSIAFAIRQGNVNVVDETRKQ